MLRLGLILPLSLIVAQTALGQRNCTGTPGPVYNGYYGLPGSPGVVIAPGWGYGIGWGWGPGWGWWNGGVNGSFYSNGLSVYGQPIPTPGAITPGFFGGSDNARNYWNTPPYLGLGWGGYRSPLPNVHGPAKDFPRTPLPPGYEGPRFATRDVRRRFDETRADPLGESNRQMADFYRVNYGIVLRVILPEENCPVYLQGQPMTATGKERLYQSPKLPQGTNYKYTVLAKLPGDRSETREVTGKAGDTLTVDFTTPTVQLETSQTEPTVKE